METIGIKDIVDAIMEAAKFPPRARNNSWDGQWLPKDAKEFNKDVILELKKFIVHPMMGNKAGIVISGKVSSGKTLTLGRMARAMIEIRATEFKKQYDEGDEPEVPIYYLPTHECSIIMNNSWDDRSKRAYLDLRLVEILFIDDIDKLIIIFLNEKGCGMLDALIRDRFNNDRPTIITSGTPTDQLDGSDSIITFLKSSFHQIEIRSSFSEGDEDG